MSSVEAPERSSASQQGEFLARITDETFAVRTITFDDRKVTGGQIADAAGAHPAAEFVVLAQLQNYELEQLRPTETADLTKTVRFFVIKGDASYGFVIDGLTMVWPQKMITGLTLKRLVHKDDDAFEVLLQREDQPDKVIGDDDDVRLVRDGVEMFTTRLAKVALTIIVEGTPHQWTKKKINYAELVTLEVPDYAQHPDITYSVKYTNGPNNKPEGTLAKDALVKVKDGMIFSVSETGQS